MTYKPISKLGQTDCFWFVIRVNRTPVLRTFLRAAVIICANLIDRHRQLLTCYILLARPAEVKKQLWQLTPCNGHWIAYHGINYSVYVRCPSHY